MNPKTFLIASTAVVDWPELLKITKAALGRSISRGLDASGMRASNLAVFVCSLDEIENPGKSHPINSVVKAGHLLDFIQFTFLVICGFDLIEQILMKTKLSIIRQDTISSDCELGIISGTASCWREAVINLCNRLETKNIRLFLNQIIEELERLGLKDLFKDYRRDDQPDQTFLLTYRK